MTTTADADPDVDSGEPVLAEQQDWLLDLMERDEIEVNTRLRSARLKGPKTQHNGHMGHLKRRMIYQGSISRGRAFHASSESLKKRKN